MIHGTCNERESCPVGEGCFLETDDTSCDLPLIWGAEDLHHQGNLNLKGNMIKKMDNARLSIFSNGRSVYRYNNTNTNIKNEDIAFDLGSLLIIRLGSGGEMYRNTWKGCSLLYYCLKNVQSLEMCLFTLTVYRLLVCKKDSTSHDAVICTRKQESKNVALMW